MAKRGEMDQWLLKLDPGLKATFDARFDKVEAERQGAPAARQAGIDREEDALVAEAKSKALGKSSPAAPKAAAAKGAKGGASTPATAADGTLVIDLDKVGGRIIQVPSDPDDPDSPMVDRVDVPMPPPPIPDNLPSPDITIQFLQKLPDHASIMALNYGQAVTSSCHAFEQYAKDRIDEMVAKEQEEESDLASILVGSLASGLLTAVGGGLAEKAAEAIGKKVAEAMVDAVKSGVVDGVKSAVSRKAKSDAEALRGAIGTLSQKTLDAQTVIQDKVRRVFHEFVSPMIDELRAHIQSKSTKPALKPEDAQAVYPYVRDDDEGLDRLCVMHGVPDRSSAKDINVRVFGQLVRQFELTKELRRVDDYINRGGSGKYAQEMSDEAVNNSKILARNATKQRRAELDKAEEAAGG